jgi:hypothetical protein
MGIEFHGQAWSNPSDWIYFDTILDFDRLRKKLQINGQYSST